MNYLCNDGDNLFLGSILEEIFSPNCQRLLYLIQNDLKNTEKLYTVSTNNIEIQKITEVRK